MNDKLNSPERKAAALLVKTIAVCLFAALMMMTLSGLAWQDHQLASGEPTLTQTPVPTPTATPAAETWLTRFLKGPADPASQTNGIIIAGGLIAFIIIGGTLRATRRKP
jgi:hypothetical protein